MTVHQLAAPFVELAGCEKHSDYKPLVLVNDNLVNFVPIHGDMLADMLCYDSLFFGHFLLFKKPCNFCTRLFLSFASFFCLATASTSLHTSFLLFIKRFRSSRKSFASHFISANM